MKHYIKPSTQVISVHVSRILAASDTVNMELSNTNADQDKEILVRDNHNLWNDEW